MVVGLLGILKAGLAYVPIDPDYPENRIRYMLEDSKAELILTHTDLKESLLLDSGKKFSQVLCLDEGNFLICPDNNPPKKDRPNDLAYVIYTSGSTGKPKGVMIENHSLSNFLQDMKKRTNINSSDKLLAITSLSFDIAALELYLPLISGSCLQLFSKPHDVQALQSQLHTHKISFMQATPATWQLLRHAGWQTKYPLNIFCGGEACSKDLANYLLENSVNLWNVYGPTETTIWSSAYHIRMHQYNIPAIGQPISNTSIVVLDTQCNIQPIGIPGELCISGEGLARGYLNLPELSWEKYIWIDLFGKCERVYKTGDLARWSYNGTLECLGRIDNQVKIRGFRIELGEIETQLSKHTDVQEAIVVPQSKDSGEKFLVAYVILKNKSENQSTPVAGLRIDLQGQLPDYMIPAFFVVLEKFPLLPNGKINHRALPEPDHMNMCGPAYMHPRHSLEFALSQVWEQVLQISPISVFDGFFDIGGDSLKAIRLITAVNHQFDVDLPLNTLFQYDTIEQMACVLRHDTQTDIQNSPLVALQTGGSNAPIFCVHAAGGIVFRFQQVAKYMSVEYGHPFYALQAKGIEPGETPYTSIEVMAQAYVQAIRETKPVGPYLLAGWSMGGTIAFEMARVMENMGETVSGILMIDAPSPDMDAYAINEIDDVDFLLERLEPAAGVSIQDSVEQQDSVHAKKQYIVEQKKQLGLFPPDIQPAEAEQRLAVHKHHNRLLCRYRPCSAIQAGIMFIRATEETTFDEKMKNPVPGWAEWTHQGIAEYTSPGNHFNMFSNEYSPVLAETLQDCIQGLDA